MNDQQFSVIRNSAVRDTLTAALGVMIVLWLALRSWKIIAAVTFSLLVGLATTAALGLALVGSFNLISIAFFVLFVGLGVDFGIQFSVRYRAERHEQDDLRLGAAECSEKGRHPARPCRRRHCRGLLCFPAHQLPRPFRAWADRWLRYADRIRCSITLVPAALALLDPPGEAAPVGFGFLAPLDDFLQRHRIAAIVGTIGLTLAGTPLLLHLPFDFNPINLQNPNSPAVVTYRQLQNDPETSASDAELLAPSLEQAEPGKTPRRAAGSLRTITLNSLCSWRSGHENRSIEVRVQHGSALSSIRSSSLCQRTRKPSLRSSRRQALSPRRGQADKVPTRMRRGTLLRSLTVWRARMPGRAGEGRAGSRATACVTTSNQLRESLSPQPISIANLPPDLVRDWVMPDGRARVEALPKGDPTTTNVLQTFAAAVLKAEPSATGPAISYYEWEEPSPGHSSRPAFSPLSRFPFCFSSPCGG